MSIMYCEKHDRKWDSDRLGFCPLCENEPSKLEEALDQEIKWCCANRDTSGKDKSFEDGFIAGLKQAGILCRSILRV